jgi:hypothetical protein
MIDLHGRESGIDRDDDDGQLAARIYKLDVTRSIGKQERQSIARPEAGEAERGSQALDAIVKLSKTQPVVAEGECGPIGIVPDGSFNGMDVHHFCSPDVRARRQKVPSARIAIPYELAGSSTYAMPVKFPSATSSVFLFDPSRFAL